MRAVQSSKHKAQSAKPGHRINIQVAPHLGAKVDGAALRRLAAEVLSQEGVAEQTELSLVITDDEALRELNRRFRGVDAPTDVLSFGTGTEERFVSAPEGPPYLGDVVISYQRALAQAEELGQAAERELKLLVVHGILHLLGYDHQEEAAARKMREKESKMTNDE
jgi:probable rRNA maturation factor